MTLIKASATSIALGVAAAIGLGSAPAWAECTLVLSHPQIDLGVVKRDSLVVNGQLGALGQRTLSLDLQCDVESDLTLFYRGAAEDGERFKFGDRGDYQLQVRDAVVDGVPVDLGEVGVARQLPGRTEPSLSWRPEHGITPVKDGLALHGRSLQAHIDITVQAPMAAMRVQDETQWLAQALIETRARDASRELSVAATLIPVACTPQLSGGGRVDYGRIPVSTLNPARVTDLPTRTVELTIDCDAMALFGLGVVDNREGTANSSGPGNFGLGLSAGKPIGHYFAILGGTRVDGWPAAYELLGYGAGSADQRGG